MENNKEEYMEEYRYKHEEKGAKERDGFKRGMLSGIILCVAALLVFNSCKIVYSRFIKHELTRDEKLLKIFNTIDKNYVNDYEKDDIEEGIYQGAVAALNDKYSYYMPADQFKSFMDNTNGSYVGIGVIVGIVDEEAAVLYVFDGSPAQSSGIEVGDILKKVDSTEVTKDNFEDVIKSIKDETTKDTTVTVYRESLDKELEINISKNQIDMPTVSHEMLEDKIGKITISKFDAVTLDQFNEAFDELTNEGMQALIIDLRDNPGGLLTVVAKITDRLVPEGYITYTEDKNGKKSYINSDEECFGKPLVILVNGNSASASEVLSGAVKDMGAGKLVGTKTYGKGVVQSIFEFGDGSGMKLTIAKYYTPSGVCIDGIGIEPDYQVDFEDGFDMTKLNNDNDVQLKKGIEVIKGMLAETQES